MTEYKVEQLNYAGDDEAGAYCEALLIISGGKEHYVLHRGVSIYDGSKGKFVHEKINFTDRVSLLTAFPGVYINGWRTTNERCAFNHIPLEEFKAADKRGLE